MERVGFVGASGQRLVGLLDTPDRTPVASALVAHCFTCGKDSIAAARIARALTERGFAVLRFDVTGLGESEGSFGEATFSMDVADLTAAAAFLRARNLAPAVLIGHSLGGAAVLAAAGRIPEVRAVATVGAPSDPAHVTNLLGPAVAELERNGRARVRLGGRAFTLHQAFLDDIRAQPQRERIADLGRALLVMHSPQDEIVGIENARQIYDTARHPKSFVSLDGADHLLTRAADARYVADVLAAWAPRYLDAAPIHDGAPHPGALAAGLVRVKETDAGRLQHQVRVGRHVWVADEPPEVGGDDAGPSPFDLLLAALGTCTSMTMRMYAERKGWPLPPLEIHLTHDRIRAEDCATCDTREGWVDRFSRDILLPADLSEDRRDALLRIADRCPVHHTLTHEVVVRTVAVPTPAPVQTPGAMVTV